MAAVQHEITAQSSAHHECCVPMLRPAASQCCVLLHPNAASPNQGTQASQETQPGDAGSPGDPGQPEDPTRGPRPTRKSNQEIQPGDPTRRRVLRRVVWVVAVISGSNPKRHQIGARIRIPSSNDCDHGPKRHQTTPNRGWY